jgi:DNA-binding MarR family transcriptional regulator
MEYFEILIKLRKIMRSVNLESKRIEKELGISIPQLLVLQFLSTHPGYRALAKDIKEYLKLNASTVTGIIKRLEIKGLVARTPKPGDRRAAFITLTAVGAELLEQSPTTLQEKLTRRLRRLSPEQIVGLNEHIELLVHILDVDQIDSAPLLTIEEMSESIKK